jgi:hypothetical protein
MIRIGPSLCSLCLLLGACDSTGPANLVGRPPDSSGTDTTPAPPDTVPGDSTGGDSLPPSPGPDSTAPPPDTTGPVLPPYTPKHSGIPFGPAVRTKGESSRTLLPPSTYGAEFTAALLTAYTPTLLASLEAARRTDGRVLLGLTGNEASIRDDNGFSISKWKKRVDRFRGMDLSSYIADGTIVGHFIMDEPSDPSNWNGKLVSPAEIDEMARYSKEIWPGMATIIRGWPAYLKGYEYKHLDAAWAQYHQRFGSIEEFLASNIRDAKASNLALVGGLNLLNGGTSASGIPGRGAKKWAMSAGEIRTWGNAMMSEPYFCAFIVWQYDANYFSRPDIREALSDLSRKAQSHAEEKCRRQP